MPVPRAGILGHAGSTEPPRPAPQATPHALRLQRLQQLPGHFHRRLGRAAHCPTGRAGPVCLHGKVKHLYTEHVLHVLNSLPAQLSDVPFELHATISNEDVVGVREHKHIASAASFENITNHGVQNSTEAWSDFLTGCSVMLGIGQPYAAPTVLDAIAHGAVYVDYVYPSPIRFIGINLDITLMSQHSIVADSFGS
jgi:hypothetical protein